MRQRKDLAMVPLQVGKRKTHVILCGQKVDLFHLARRFQQHLAEPHKVVQLKKERVVRNLQQCFIGISEVAINKERHFYLMDVPYVWILHPNLSKQAADVRLEQSPIAVARGIFCYSYLLMVFPI